MLDIDSFRNYLNFFFVSNLFLNFSFFDNLFLRIIRCSFPNFGFRQFCLRNTNFCNLKNILDLFNFLSLHVTPTKLKTAMHLSRIYSMNILEFLEFLGLYCILTVLELYFKNSIIWSSAWIILELSGPRVLSVRTPFPKYHNFKEFRTNKFKHIKM